MVSRLPNCATAFGIPVSRSASSIEPHGRNSRSSRASSRAAFCMNWKASLAFPKRGVCGAVPARAFANQRGVALSFGHARARAHLTELEAVRAHALGERLRARYHRCALSQPDARALGSGSSMMRRTGTRLANELAPLESRLAKIIEDQQRAEEERDEPRCAPLGAGRAQGGASGLAGGGVRLVRSASRRRQASAASHCRAFGAWRGASQSRRLRGHS